MTDTTPPAIPCSNCGFNLGVHPCCAQCGQRHKHGRLSFRNLVDDITSEILEWNLPWLLTLKMLTLKPGRVALDYIHGKRSRYVNPLKYMFYVVGILALLATLLENVSGGDEFFSFFSGALDNRLARGGDVSRLPRVLQFLLNHSALLLLVYSPLVVGAFKLTYAKAGRNAIEVTCFVFYLIGHLALLMFLMALAGMLLGLLPPSLGRDAVLWFLGFMLLLLYINRSSMVFFGKGLAYSFVISLLLFVLLFVLLRVMPGWLLLLYAP